MARTQKVRINPPREIKEKDFSGFNADMKGNSLDIQRNLSDLFLLAHDHTPTDTVPTSSEGQPGDMIPYYANGTARLYIKVAKSQWAYVALTLA